MIAEQTPLELQKEKIIEEISISSSKDNKIPVRYSTKSNTEIRINVKAGTTVTLLEQSEIGKVHDVNVYLDIYENAHVTLVRFVTSPTQITTQTKIFRNATLTTITLLLSSATVERTTCLHDEGAAVEEYDCVLLAGKETLKLSTKITNEAASTKAHSLLRGVACQESSVECKGLMKIEKNARQASSWLGQHIFLLSNQARARSLPFLEIENNDVQAYHAASVSPVDDEQITYLRSRGVTLDESKTLLAQGYVEPVILKIVNEDILRDARELLRSRWQYALS